MKINRKLQISFYSVTVCSMLFIALDFAFPLKINENWSKQIVDEKDALLHLSLSKDDKWRLKTELNEISPILQKTIIEKEDKYFYYHPGINVFSIIRALFNNTVLQKRTSGASTISMQVARMIEKRPRTLLSKMIEVFRALQLEFHYSKNEILQWYLNLAPYGGNIEGVKSAAFFISIKILIGFPCLKLLFYRLFPTGLIQLIL